MVVVWLCCVCVCGVLCGCCWYCGCLVWLFWFVCGVRWCMLCRFGLLVLVWLVCCVVVVIVVLVCVVGVGCVVVGSLC